MSCSLLCGLLTLACSQLVVAQAPCQNPLRGGTKPWKIDSAVAFQTKQLQVDADGAPDSYRVDGKGLSATCSGVLAIVDGHKVTPKSDPAHWESLCIEAWAKAVATGDYSQVDIFGFETDSHNRPVVQKEGDPLPGVAFLTRTALTVPGTPEGTQRHYVDATRIPYIVLTKSFLASYGVKVGDLAAVYWPKKNKIAFALVGDTGPALGEASIKLHRDLGNEPVVKRKGILRASNGIDGQVSTLVFPGVNVPGSVDAAGWATKIDEAGKVALAGWGGESRFRACFE